MHFNTSKLVILALALALTSFAIPVFGKSAGTVNNGDSIATITAMENASVKADIAGDSSFVEKNYADNFSGGSSWGQWDTKQSILADMKDSNNNKMKSEEISELSVRLYGGTAIATYKSTYDSTYHGEHRARTILSTDTFVQQDGTWRLVASHSSELAK